MPGGTGNVDEQRRELIHELILSNRVVENMLKNVNEIHGITAAEQVVKNFLEKDQSEEEMLEKSISKGPHEVSSVEQQEETFFSVDSQGKTQIERLIERTPKLVNKFMQTYYTPHGGIIAPSSSSVPKNRRDETTQAKNNNDELIEQAVNQIQQVCENLEPICQILSSNI